MQQYRVNYVLLIGLFVGTLIASVGVYALWRFQIGRNAGALIAGATEAHEKGDLRNAAQKYQYYLSIRPDDDEVRVKLANVWADVTEQVQILPEDWGRAISFLEETARSMPEEKAIQRRLVDIYGRINQVQEALRHLELMVAKYPEDTELQVLQMQYLARARKYDEVYGACVRLVGFDDEANSFDLEKAVAPKDVGTYGTLASLLRIQRDEPELADRVMDQLIKVNPQSAEALLHRGRYLIGANEPDKGRRDIEKAYALEPDNADVLLAMAERAQNDEKLDQAREYLERGKEKHPKDARFYQSLAGLEMQNKDYASAMALVEEGLKQVSGLEALTLLAFRADLQFIEGDIRGARDTAERMRKSGFRSDYVEWTEARILLSDNKWFEARKMLRSLKSRMGNELGFGDQIGVQLGLCYEQLGQIDQAMQEYEVVLQRNPNNEPAAMGKQRILIKSGRPASDGSQQELEQRIAAELEKPKEERDWSEIDKAMEELAEDRNIEGIARDLFWARLMLMRENFDGARKYLIAAREKDPENIQVPRLAVLVLRFDPNQGPEKAMMLLEKTTAEFGDQPGLRTDRADLLIAMNQEDLTSETFKKQMITLAKAPTEWTDNQKVELWSSLASRYLAVGMRDDGVACLERIADLKPDDLPTRMTLFSLALEANDDVAMRAAQDRILKLVGSKNESNWQFAEARRLLSLHRRGQLDQESLAVVRSLVDRALQQRRDWFELHLVKAELELVEGNEEAALTHFEKAQQLGRPSPQAILYHVRLLTNRGQFESAKKIIEQLPKSVREGNLGQVYAEILVNSGHLDEAVEVGKKFVEAAPEDADRKLKYGQLLARGASTPELAESRQEVLLKDAASVLQQSAELAPDVADTWMALVTVHVMLKDEQQARSALQHAQLSLPEDQLVAVMARGYELLRQWFNAETMYLAAYRANPENYRLAQQLATFYLGSGYPRNDKNEKAVPLINQILRAGAEEKLPPHDAGLMWARRVGAQLLANTRDYQRLRTAERLLRSNWQGGALSTDDRLIMAQILAPRPEPISRDKAMKLLEQVDKSQKLNLESQLILGQMYYALGNWRKCRTRMQQAISESPTSADARIQFIDLILRRGEKSEYGEAARQLARLRELAPGDGRTIQLTVRLAAKTDKQQEARSYLLRLLPQVKESDEITDDQLAMMEFIATLLVELGDLDNAEKLYRTTVARDPRKTLALANFLGEHRDVQKCMDLLASTYQADRAEGTARTAINAVRARRDEVGDKYDGQIQAWLDRALLENPDSIPLKMLQADFFDVRKDYSAAAKVYRELLERQELAGFSRAVVLNNLAFLVALEGSEAETDVDPLTLVQEAAHILGPTADILDTRAVVYISRKEFLKAIKDLEYSVTDNPSPSKYFHKTLAHLGAGQNKEALEAWEMAESLGSVRDDLNRMEYDVYEQVKSKVEQLRNQDAKLTEADRFRAAG